MPRRHIFVDRLGNVKSIVFKKKKSERPAAKLKRRKLSREKRMERKLKNTQSNRANPIRETPIGDENV